VFVGRNVNFLPAGANGGTPQVRLEDELMFFRSGVGDAV